MTERAKFTAIVLAGSRGPEDPVARAAGVSHKALARVGGVPMLDRVLDALVASERIGQIIVSIADAAIARPLKTAQALARAGSLVMVTAEPTPSPSVTEALRHESARSPFLIVTADHPLLTAEMVNYFCDAAEAAGDVAVGVVARTVVEKSYPETVRTYLRFSDDGFSGCNLFALLTPLALGAPEFWRRAELQRKRPWKLARRYGFGNLLRFVFRRFDLDGAMDRASRVMGMRVVAIRMPFAEAAIDVDRPQDLILAERIASERQTPD